MLVLPTLAALLNGPASDADFLPPGFKELFLTADAALQWTVSDTFDRPPLRAIIDEVFPPPDEPEEWDDSDILAHVVLLHVAGVVVPANRVAETKDFIRRQAY